MEITFDLTGAPAEHLGQRVVTAHGSGDKLVVAVEKGWEVNRVVLRRGERAGAVRSACTCPGSGNCPHISAAMFVAHRHPEMSAWLKQGASRAAGAEREGTAASPSVAAEAAERFLEEAHRALRLRTSVPTTAPKQKRDREAEAVADWLREVAVAHASVSVPARPPTEHDVLYVLTYDGPAEIAVSAWQCRRTKSGALAPTRCFSLGSAFKTRVPKVGASDLALMAQLRSATTERDSDDAILGPDASALVLRLVETGRCRAADHTGPLLQVGDARDATLSWTCTPGGVQRPTVAVTDGGVALLFDAPLYLDAGQARIGPLRLTTTPALVRAFLAGPSLSPEAAATLVDAQHAKLTKLGVPAPRVLKVENVTAPVPTPCLKLHTRRIEAGYFRDGLALDAASLQFRYGRHLVPAGGEPAVLTDAEGDVVRRASRRAAEEAAAVDLLGRMGFRPLLDCMPDAHAHIVRYYLSGNQQGMELTLARSLQDPGVAAWEEFVQSRRPELLAAGWQIEIDRSFRHGVVAIDRWFGAVAPAAASGWFEVDLGVEIGSERFDLLPVLLEMLRVDNALVARAIAEQRPLRVQLQDGRRVDLPTERLQRILGVLLEMQVGGRVEQGKLRVRRAMAAQVEALEGHVDGFQWQGGDALRALATRLRSFEAVERVAAPPALRADLRAYQLDGLAWLQFLREHDLGGVLADDMGLGKTVQALAHLLVEKAAGRLDRPALVVTPTSVVRNWESEAARFAPDLRVLVLHGGDRRASFGKIGDVDLVLTTYPLVLRDEEVLAAQPFHLLLLDEAQAIKNARAKVARALRRLDARHRLCLTGTPLENNLSELWAQFDFLMPGVLGDAKTFGRVFRTPIEKGNDAARRAALAARVRPFVLRRTKAAVATELPPKTEIVHTVEFDGAQRDLYESIRLSVHEAVQRAIAEKGLDQAQIAILDALLKLRQVCCDPRLVKLDAAKSVTDSAKMDALLDLLPALLGDGRRVLLFSQFTSMLALIEAALTERGIAFVKLTGQTRDRQTPIKRFQAGEVPVFLISLKAGGTGLNLTAADAVIHYDPWWNPAAEQQATDRAHRIGQDKPVFVYKLIVAGTVEERIAKLQDRKRALAAGILDGEGAQGAALTRGDVEALLAPIEG